MTLPQRPSADGPDTDPGQPDWPDGAVLLNALPGAVALIDVQGALQWCNRRLPTLLGRQAADCIGRPLHQLLGLSNLPPAAAAQAIGLGQGTAQVVLPALGGGERRTFDLHLATLPDQRRLATLTAAAPQAVELAHLNELLNTVQDLGRLGVWERDLRTLRGRWSHHVHRIRGTQPAEGNLNLEASMRMVVDEDRAQVEKAVRRSMAQAGRYAQRYRVRGVDGVVRHVYSQWEVKDGADGRPERAVGVLSDDTDSWNLARFHGETVEQLSLTVELGRIAVWRSDLRTGQVQMNDMGLRLLGLDRRTEPLTIDALRAMIHPDDLDQSHAANATAIATGTPVDNELRVRLDDGTLRHFLTRRMVQRDAAGEAVAVIAVALDMTERIEGARAQAGLLHQFELTARAAGIGYWSFDPATTKIRWSDQIFALHGLPLQSEVPETRAWVQAYVHADDREHVLKLFRRWIHGEAPDLATEFRIVRTDGGMRHVLSHARFEGPPGKGELFGVLVDVTERRVAEAALRDASERASLATRGAGLGTWELDPQSGEAHWDEQMWRLRGLQPRAEALGRDERLALVHPDDLKNVTLAHDMDIPPGQMSNLEFRVRWPDGQWRWLASRSVTVSDKRSGRPKRIGVNWDITDTRTAQLARQERAAVQQQGQARSQFLSRMSHELRTPLNAVLGFAQLLLADGERVSAATRKRRLEQIQGAGKHLLALIDDVLDLSSLDGGEIRISAQPVALDAMVTETLALVERPARQMKLKLRHEVPPLVVVADATRLRQVLLNLLSNAVKYNREGGSVTVQAEALTPWVMLRVLDTGRGMSEEQLAHAFEPFNRLGAEREAIEGTGIGLSIVKSLVQRMGGSVQVTSTPGQGSQFEVRLPDAAHLPTLPSALDEPAQTQRVAPAQGQRSRVLYIEDNPVNLLIVQELVALRPDLSLDSAANGLDGIEQARALRPELILVDMQLPDIDGYEVLRRLRADPSTAGIACVSVSANAMPDDIKRARRAGFADYWTKPLDFQQFMKSLETYFGPMRH